MQDFKHFDPKQAAMDEARGLLEAAARAAMADDSLPEKELPAFVVEVPNDVKNGDLASNFAMAGARVFGMPPRKIAEAVAAAMPALEETHFSRVEIAGPGFINLFLAPGWFADVVLAANAAGADYGRTSYGKGEKVNVEFVSANPTGPMHLGNARGGALGDCLAAVLDFAGYNVSREFYVNDAGNQIAKFGLSLDIRYQQLFLGEDAVQLPEDSYHGEDIIERAKEFAAVNGDKYMSASEQERRQALIDFALPKNIAAMKENMAKYRINYDTWFLESTLHNDGELEETLNIMRDKGLTYEKDGALWYKNKEVLAAKLREQGKSEEEIERLELKDEVLIRTNGNPTYFAADIAYHRNKLQIRGFDKAIDVWGADHHGHVARMKGALDAIGCNGDDLDIILMQLVRLTRDGEVVRMSKRSGKAITLVDLLEEIPIDAVRFLFNMREPGSQMDFDLDLAVEQSSQNPVYYCQYAHARICSILRKLASEGVEPRECTIPELALLTAPEEKELIKHLSGLTDEIIASAKNYDPAKITRYAVELATLFHKFYNACRVGVEDESLMQARLSLCLCVRTVLRNVLTMFSISVPENM